MTPHQDSLAIVYKDVATVTTGLVVGDFLKRISGIFGQRAAFASSFGLEDQVIIDLIAKHSPRIVVFTIDTGRLPRETDDLIEKTRRRYGLEIEVLVPDRLQVEAMAAWHGADLFYDSVENRKLCCHVRKVNVLKRELAGLDAWICGLRREQSVTRTDVQRVEWDDANGLIKINPLADWTTQQVWDYIRANDVPYNVLHDSGYPSIGCAPCTRAIAAGEDIRAGRWWWESPEHKECGLHLGDGKANIQHRTFNVQHRTSFARPVAGCSILISRGKAEQQK